MSARPGRIVGDFLVDAPRPRDPQGDSALHALRANLLALLSAEVEAVARDERDSEWEGNPSGRPAVLEPAENVGAEI